MMSSSPFSYAREIAGAKSVPTQIATMRIAERAIGHYKRA